MKNNPSLYDVVFGGQNMAPMNSAVLGGIKGVKRRLLSQNVSERIAALSEALNYGSEGLELLLQALNSNDKEINFAAYQLLKHREELEVKVAASKYLQYYWLIYCNGLYCTLVRANCYDLMKFYPDGTILSVSVSDSEPISIQRLVEWFNQNKNDENNFIYKIENNNINVFIPNTLDYCGKLDTTVGKIFFSWESYMFNTSVREYQFFHIPDLE
jgi:hypothetical protein